MVEETSTGAAAGPPIGAGVGCFGDLSLAGMVLLQTDTAVGDQDRPDPVRTCYRGPAANLRLAGDIPSGRWWWSICRGYSIDS
jgi:hypothetical protein